MLTSEEKAELLYLRLLLARAAQKDSLNWWEDDSLTASGDYLLERLFLNASVLIGRTLALEAAKTRFKAVFDHAPDALHLYRLDKSGEIEFLLLHYDLLAIEVPSQPITSHEMLERHLKEKTGAPPKYKTESVAADHSIEIRLTDNSNMSSVLLQARALAWASLASKPGDPVLPYMKSL